MASLFPAYITSGRKNDRVQDFPVSPDSGETGLVGELMLYDTTSNRIERCGADPSVIGVISEGVTENARVLTDTGYMPFYKLDESTILALSSSTTPAISHIGDTYGITRATGGQWQLDTAKTGSDARVKVHNVDITAGIFYVNVLVANLQYA